MDFKKFLIVFFVLIFMANAFAVDVTIVSEKHDLISHEVVLSVDNKEALDKSKAWDFNIIGVNDRLIQGVEYSKKIVSEEPVFENVTTRIDCGLDYVGTYDFNGDSGVFSSKCATKKNPKINDNYLYTCQSNPYLDGNGFEVIDCFYNEVNEVQVGTREVVSWVSLSKPVESKNKDKYVLRLPSQVFKTLEKEQVKISWEVPISDEQWGSSGNWTMNPSNWWDSNWSNKQELSLNTQGVLTSDVTNEHAILIHVDSSNTDFWDNSGLLNDVNDVRFTNSDSNVSLDYHIELVDTDTNDLWAWVGVPSFDADVNTLINMYYGNASAVDNQDESGTYPSAYKLGYHMSEGTGNILDSTSTSNDSTTNPSTSASDSTGAIGKAVTLNGSKASADNTMFTISDAVLSQTEFTATFWYNNNGNAFSQALEVFWWFGNFGSDAGVGIYADASGKLNVGIGDGSVETELSASSLPADSDWHQVIIAYSDTGNNVSAWVDGVEFLDNDNANTPTHDGTGFISHAYWSYIYSLDEMKYLDYAFSIDEVNLLYASENDSLVSFGAQELGVTASIDANFVHVLNGRSLDLNDTSIVVDTNVINWTWDYNGIVFSTDQNVIGFDLNFNVDYNVCLDLNDGIISDSACEVISVSDLVDPVINFIDPSNNDLRASKLITFNVVETNLDTIIVKINGINSDFDYSTDCSFLNDIYSCSYTESLIIQEGAYNLEVTALDLASNNVVNSVDFTYSTGTLGGGGGGTIPSSDTQLFEVIGIKDNFLALPFEIGDERTFNITVKNIGNSIINEIDVSLTGEVRDYVTLENTFEILNPNEEYTFVFNYNIEDDLKDDFFDRVNFRTVDKVDFVELRFTKASTLALYNFKDALLFNSFGLEFWLLLSIVIIGGGLVASLYFKKLFWGILVIAIIEYFILWVVFVL
jgi:hypothetical protein